MVPPSIRRLSWTNAFDRRFTLLQLIKDYSVIGQHGQYESINMPFAIVILIVAAIWNWHAGVVPNALPLLLLMVFIPFAWATQLPLEEIGFRIALCVASLVLAFVLFTFDHIGGGAAKLIVATTVWLSWPVAVVYVLICLAIGVCLHYALEKTEVQIVEWISEQYSTIAACLGIILIVMAHLGRSGQ